MASVEQQSVRNALLSKLSSEDFALLTPHLQPIEAEMREFLIEANTPIRNVYFPENTIASILAEASEARIEVGIIGREGFVGVPVVLGVDRTPHGFMVQAPGIFLSMRADDLRTAADQSPSLRQLLTRFGYVLGVQTAATAYANASLPIEARLARWILMTHDRLDGDDLPLTHEFMSLMLGVRRPGVTVAVHVLEGNRLIRATRGRITVLDRPRLEELADNAYGIPEAEYASVIGNA